MSSFGTKFILVNDIQQPLDPNVFGGGPWTHFATVQRGFDEYMCFQHTLNHKVYIEQVDNHDPDLFVKIKDSQLYSDLVDFLRAAKILDAGVGREFKISKGK